MVVVQLLKWNEGDWMVLVLLRLSARKKGIYSVPACIEGNQGKRANTPELNTRLWANLRPLFRLREVNSLMHAVPDLYRSGESS